jgi:acetylornithine/succinyldiaminopimelate/putrescine aminotransferase
VKATALFVDGPCRLQKRVLTFDTQPPEFLSCGGKRYTYSANQGLEYLNYVLQGGVNDAGSAQIRGVRDVTHAWAQLHHALNHTVPRRVTAIRQAGRRIRRAVR